MAKPGVILKSDPHRGKGTVSRAVIRKAVREVNARFAKAVPRKAAMADPILFTEAEPVVIKFRSRLRTRTKLK